ncbi:hypothetical protein ACIA5D_17295 [Actinoplanes sp. NPDC051513]|uniref:hypothetical protein n=1 Tax=Actinoplanes sp. NPDC051513 TaxID=3363908 RepID=UPI00378BE40C
MTERDARDEHRRHQQRVQSEVWHVKGSWPEGWFRAREDDDHSYGFVNVRAANAIRLVPADTDADRYRIKVFFGGHYVDLGMGPYLHSNAIDVLDAVLQEAREGPPES